VIYLRIAAERADFMEMAGKKSLTCDTKTTDENTGRMHAAVDIHPMQRITTPVDVASCEPSIGVHPDAGRQ
jgi:hypothetical protein